MGDHGKRRSSAANLDESGNIEGTGSDKDSVLGKGTSKTKGSGKGKKQGMKKFEKGDTANNKDNPSQVFKLMKYATSQICEVNVPGASLDQNLEVATAVLAELEKGVSDQVCKDLLVMLKDAIMKKIAPW